MVMDTGSKTGKWYDLHCHVLPGLDDGCRDCEESIQVLRESAKQGVAGMMATPHYYPRESIIDFIIRREKALLRLQERMQQESGSLPLLCCGAEVAYHTGLAYDDDLEKLCFGQSRYLLLELPFSEWSSPVIRDILGLIGRNIIPIIAHAERYLDFQNPEFVRQLFELDVFIQVNAGSLMGWWQGRIARRLVRAGRTNVLASDCHNITERPPNLGKIAAKSGNGRLSEEIEIIRQQNQKIFMAAMGQKA